MTNAPFRTIAAVSCVVLLAELATLASASDEAKGVRARYPTSSDLFTPQIGSSVVSSNIVSSNVPPEVRRRRIFSSHYQNVFGQSKVIEGSEFVPWSMDSFTGKLATSRRETFKWHPDRRLLQHFLVPY
ncbi:hypothetical protein AAVH_19555 [Aphelenchoides avenae]|nr:hypothetical protein AAVH_19555 [Aphelenchus avenae]